MDKIAVRLKKSSPSFTLGNRLYRGLWGLVYCLLIRYTPIMFRGWRIFIYKLFGADINGRVNIYPKAIIWSPQNLEMRDGSCIANNTVIYNQDKITLLQGSLISQGAHLCTGTHNFESINFDLVTSPITVGEKAWICAEAFIGPGVTVREGAVLGARAVAFKDLEKWTVYTGNPAMEIKKRIRCSI
jgi:putative colanic acid biosynthesis acetyltransferase WcaF